MPNVTIQNATVIKVGELETRGTYDLRILVVETNDNPSYPQFHSIQFGGKSVDKLDKIGVGDVVEIDINLNGRAWTNKLGEQVYFNSLDGWKIAVNSKGVAPTNNAAAKGDDDDLPF